MELTDILSVSGLPGLYRVVSQRNDGLIVRSLDGTDTKFAPSRRHGFSPLESIAIYTHTDTIELKEVFSKMKDSSDSIPSEKENNEVLKNYFSKIVADYDPDRVRISDIKKVILWFGLLDAHDLIATTEEEEEE